MSSDYADKLDARSEALPIERTDVLVFRGEAWVYSRESASGLNRSAIFVFSPKDGGAADIHVQQGHSTRLELIQPGSGDSEREVDGLTDRAHVSVSKAR